MKFGCYLQESVVRLSNGKSGFSDSDIFEESEVGDLVGNSFCVDLRWRFDFVRFDASHVERLLGRQVFD